jgi:hypothetical protein
MSSARACSRLRGRRATGRAFDPRRRRRRHRRRRRRRRRRSSSSRSSSRSSSSRSSSRTSSSSSRSSLTYNMAPTARASAVPRPRQTRSVGRPRRSHWRRAWRAGTPRAHAPRTRSVCGEARRRAPPPPRPPPRAGSAPRTRRAGPSPGSPSHHKGPAPRSEAGVGWRGGGKSRAADPGQARVGRPRWSAVLPRRVRSPRGARMREGTVAAARG